MSTLFSRKIHNRESRLSAQQRARLSPMLYRTDIFQDVGGWHPLSGFLEQGTTVESLRRVNSPMAAGAETPSRLERTGLSPREKSTHFRSDPLPSWHRSPSRATAPRSLAASRGWPVERQRQHSGQAGQTDEEPHAGLETGDIRQQARQADPHPPRSEGQSQGEPGR